MKKIGGPDWGAHVLYRPGVFKLRSIALMFLVDESVLNSANINICNYPLSITFINSAFEIKSKLKS